MKKFLSLIVVALMLVSILPLAAFAAPYTIDADGDCYVTVEKAEANVTKDLSDLEDEEYAEITLELNGDAGKDVKFWVLAEDLTYGTDYAVRFDDAKKDDDGYKKVQLDKNGEKEVNVKLYSKVSGKVKVLFTTIDPTTSIVAKKSDAKVSFDDTKYVKVYKCKTHADGYQDSTNGSKPTEVCTAKTDDRECNYIFYGNDDEQIISVNYEDCDDNVIGGEDGVVELNFNAVENYIAIERTTSNKKTVYANGNDSVELRAFVGTSEYKPLKGVEVTFEIVSGIGTLKEEKATTDKNGYAFTELTSEVPGTVEVKVLYKDLDSSERKYGDNKTAKATFTTTGVTKVVAEEDDNQKVAQGSTPDLTYAFYDAQGNKVKFNGTKNLKKDFNASFSVVTKPSSSSLKAEDLKYASVNDGSLKLDFSSNTLKSKIKPEGTYEIKLTLTNGNSVTYNFTVKKAGDPVRMTISYGANTVEKNHSTDRPKMKYYDADDYKVDVAVDTDIDKFTTSDASVAFIDKETGEVTGLEYGTVTITAYDTKHNLTASTLLTVGKAAAKLVCTAPATAAVNELIEVKLQLVDADGNTTRGKEAFNNKDAKAFFTVKPENAVVSAPVVADKAWLTDGTAKVTFTAYTEGTYEFAVAIGTYSGTATVVVGKNAAFGAKCVFMIGSESYMAGDVAYAGTSVAYVDANNRTMLGFRDLGAAIGATVKYEDGVATLTKGSTVVTAKAGDKFITVNGTQTAIDTEVVNKDGRLMLPFRAIFQAFGYTVSYSNGVIICK